LAAGVTFGEVGRNRDSRAAKLAAEAEGFIFWQATSDLIDGRDSIHRELPDLEVAEVTNFSHPSFYRNA
jgi:hypothetical protein